MSTYEQFIFKSSFINGEWESSDSAYQVLNPSTGEVITNVSSATPSQIDMALDSANQALPAWKGLVASERADLLMKWYDLIIENEKALAALLTAEQGKPFREALGEIRYGASFIKWFAGEAVRVYGDILTPTKHNKRMMVVKEPIGVVGALTPWNFPNAMITRKVAPALAAGCSVVLKPSELTPLSALALAHLANEVGFPAGVLNVVTTEDPSQIGDAFCSDPRVAKISFTGSTAVGRMLAGNAAANLKKLSLELGGNAPFIVFEDADIARATDGLIASKFRNNGQTCICTNRVLIHTNIKEKFIDELKRKMRDLKIGDGMERGVDIGPLISDKAVDKVRELQADAVEKGGVLAMGGQITGGQFYESTIIDNGNTDMRCFKEEIFGPLLVLYSFSDDSEAIQVANDTDYGLAAYFYTSSIDRVYRVSEALEYGMVGVNATVISDASAPFGGVKNSGQGREGSKYGLDEFLHKKYITVDLSEGS